jgi:carbonic anhydrase/acetyltransferase-like protein (isoleucine patch superfamily)
MLIEHAAKKPQIHPLAWVAPDATVCGDVAIGAGNRILYRARLIGEDGGSIRIGQECIVMENAAVRATRRHACSIGVKRASGLLQGRGRPRSSTVSDRRSARDCLCRSQVVVS